MYHYARTDVHQNKKPNAEAEARIPQSTAFRSSLSEIQLKIKLQVN